MCVAGEVECLCVFHSGRVIVSLVCGGEVWWGVFVCVGPVSIYTVFLLNGNVQIDNRQGKTAATRRISTNKTSVLVEF